MKLFLSFLILISFNLGYSEVTDSFSVPSAVVSCEDYARNKLKDGLQLLFELGYIKRGQPNKKRLVKASTQKVWGTWNSCMANCIINGGGNEKVDQCLKDCARIYNPKPPENQIGI